MSSAPERPLGARLLGVLERAGPLSLAEVANRLRLEPDETREGLVELEERVQERLVKRDGGKPRRLWGVAGDSRWRSYEAVGRVTYHGGATLLALQQAALRKLKRRRGRGAG